MSPTREIAPAGVRILADVSAGRWLEDRLVPWDGRSGDGVRLGSILPTGFAGYVRVLHPATLVGTGAPIGWSEVATRTGRTVHPLMQFSRLLGSDEPYFRADWVFSPALGDLPTREGRALTEILIEFTATPEVCYFCVWEGHGYLNSDLYFGIPRVELPSRRHLLFVASVEGVLSFLDKANLWPTPALWWPADRSWCVSTEIDLMETYLAGSEACVHRIIEDSRLEAFRVSLDDRIDFFADTLNV